MRRIPNLREIVTELLSMFDSVGRFEESEPGQAMVIVDRARKALDFHPFAVRFTDRDDTINVRYHRANAVLAHIVHVMHDHISEHSRPIVMEKLMEVLLDSGIDFITDADRAAAGLPPRGQHGLTDAELLALESIRVENMTRPIIIPITKD